MDAVLYRAKTGLPWRDLPERFGPWKSVYNRFPNWARKGHWATIFKDLQLKIDEMGSIVDGSVVRAHQDASGGKGKALIGDTGYDSNEFVQAVRDKGMKPVIHSKPERKKKHRLARAFYRRRYVVEVFFHNLERFRAVATRYEKTARNYLALVQLVCTSIWLEN